MKNIVKKGNVASLSLVAVVGLAGCGAADDVTTVIDDTVEVAQEEVMDAKDAVVDAGGDAMDDAGKMAGDAMDKAADLGEGAMDKAADAGEAVVDAVTPTTNVVEAAIASPDHSTLVAAVTAAGLAETLSGEGPFTVFAPVDSAFEALPAGTVETLLLPENKADLSAILTYHVVPAKAMSEDVVKMVTEGGGSHEVATVQGGKLILKNEGGKVTVTDESGNVATVTTADLEQSNGVIHVIDTVLLPKS